MGTSGSGKTVALKYLDHVYAKLFPTMRHYVLDSKFDGDFDDWPGRVQQDECPPRPQSNQMYQVWQPIKLIPEEIEKWLWQVRHDPPALLETDELVHLCYGRNTYSDQYNIILKTGRSPNHPVGSITLTQELSRIPPNAYKQSTHRLGFYLEGRYDLLIRNDMLKFKVENRPEFPYGVYYQHMNGRGKPEFFESIQQFLGL